MANLSTTKLLVTPSIPRSLGFPALARLGAVRPLTALKYPRMNRASPNHVERMHRTAADYVVTMHRTAADYVVTMDRTAADYV